MCNTETGQWEEDKVALDEAALTGSKAATNPAAAAVVVADDVGDLGVKVKDGAAAKAIDTVKAPVVPLDNKLPLQPTGVKSAADLL